MSNAVTEGKRHSEVTWNQLFNEAIGQLDEFEVRHILEEVTGSEPGMLHCVFEEFATNLSAAKFASMVKRRVAGEPLQYVLGRWGFRTLDLMVDRRVLIPRPETEVVAGVAIDLIGQRGDNRDALVADLGTGSGAIALSIAVECRQARVFATDLSADAIAVARANLVGLGRAANRVSLHEGRWFDALPREAEGNLDLIVSNPPYISDREELPALISDWEPSSALRAGSSGLADLRSIFEGAPRWLAIDGAIVLEMSPSQTSVVAAWFTDAGFLTSIHQDLAGLDRAVVAVRKQK